MADQPSYKSLDACDFFADGRSGRPLVPGTVPRGYLKADTGFWTGRRKAATGEQNPATGVTQAELRPNIQPNIPPNQPKPIDEKTLLRPVRDQFSFPITEKIVQHGYQRFMIYCVVCHDPLGTGHGSLFSAAIRAASLSHRSPPQLAGGPLVRGDQRGLRFHAVVRRTDSRSRPLGHRGLPVRCKQASIGTIRRL